jgi:transketolase
MSREFGKRRGVWIEIANEAEPPPLSDAELQDFEEFDLIYRSLCAMLFNYVPTSGHPGGSVSSGRFVAALLYDALDYDVADPDRADADVISFAAGHKALGLYAAWALRNEILRVGAPALLPAELKYQLRLEDLLGFRRNPIHRTPLFSGLRAKALDGHPTPATPFLRLATGASGVGVASSLGLALGALDYYGERAPRVHIVEGEGGLTPGRVYEALAFAGTSSLGNAVVHVDWNQASIDSNQVTREGDQPGDYVQWTPMELFYLQDWNVIYVADGTDFQQIVAAQRRAARLESGQPTAIVYRTTKGWRYGIEGRASHGAGHPLCSAGYSEALQPLLRRYGLEVPLCEPTASRCRGGLDTCTVEECFWDALRVVRAAVEKNRPAVERMAGRLRDARTRLIEQDRRPRAEAPAVERVYAAAQAPAQTPAELTLEPGTSTTLRGQLGKVMGYLNWQSQGGLLVAAADLLASTSVNEAARDFGAGFFNARSNPESRTLSVGGICEDAMSGVLAGLSTYGRHIGVGSSYGAFLAPLGHIAARLHAIGSQARRSLAGDAYRPFILVCAHAGLKTGEDGPTHADPQPLQLLQENFPVGAVVTLTPWEPQEIWPVMAAALCRRPAVIAPFVTRPAERVPDRAALGLAPASAAVNGLYLLHAARGAGDGTVVLQESGVAYAFVEDALPRLRRAGYDLNVYYVASAELFDLLPAEARAHIFPEERAQEAMGITGFTLPTMYRWIRSDLGRSFTLHPYQKQHFPGSGPGAVVIAEAGLDGESQFLAIESYVHALREVRQARLVGVEA